MTDLNVPMRSALAGMSGTLAPVFELTDVRYIEGAAMEWRRVLTPGVQVVLHFEETGMRIIADDAAFDLPWANIEALAARGPDVPEQRYNDSLWNLLLAGGLLHALIEMSRPYESYCWLAVIPIAGDEMIFEVEQMLRPTLQRLLDEHSG